MFKRDDWLTLSRKLDWELTYVSEEDVFPDVISGTPRLPHSAWKDWDEPFKTTYGEYVRQQAAKESSVEAVREVLGHGKDLAQLPPSWLNALKLHSATFPLAEFAAVIGNLRAARFARDSAWRTTAAFGALDELRHTQIPLALMQELLPFDGQFDWTHRFYHSNNWVAIAARHMVDELLLGANPIEFAIATNFVFETGFTNLQFIGLSALAKETGDRMFEKMVSSIQSDEARHAQIGPAVLKIIAAHDRAYAQRLLDKWFWRSWKLFAIVTGFAMDYLTPLEHRVQSFKEFMHEWVIEQYLSSLAEYGLEKPWYWEQFLESLDHYHHMVYASAYTYRATVWFDFTLPGPDERKWLEEKYPNSWPSFAPVWETITRRWQNSDPGNEFAVHGTSIVGFCHLCQIVLCGGTPQRNAKQTHHHKGKDYLFCSEPCRWIFTQEPERYENHRDLVGRVLDGVAPANLISMLRQYFGLVHENWGKDVYGGSYPWIDRADRSPEAPRPAPASHGCMLPLYGFLQGDTLGLLIFAYSHDRVVDLIERLENAAAVRVARQSTSQKPNSENKPELTLTPVLVARERRWPSTMTLATMGMKPLESFTVIYEKHNGI